MAIDGICMEILVEMVIKYEEDGLELEAGFYPEHKRSMATILFNDMQTFRSEIKKAAVRIVPFEYCLYPPENIEDDGKRIEFVKKKAAQLLEGAQLFARNRKVTQSLDNELINLHESHEPRNRKVTIKVKLVPVQRVTYCKHTSVVG
ncbi:hypothetical protein PISMIDRAFT_655940 [Pisolithus microcarpus 441]|uniref:DUF6532 domain-containing protein n=1 Tax=Pisolithus microcarpus 441 TaxID=765257 RepID=A0A0C9ZM64_9AGAM|nr:hypothetical protein PISMIDRAFT_655940 [Pisolithus microcarpus 441]